MRATGTCPKCGEKNVYYNGHHTNRGERCSLPLTNWKFFFIDVYVCTDCGYLEEYVARQDENKLALIKELWKQRNN